MQEQTNTTQRDILNTQENAEGILKESYSITEKEQIPKTPFWVVKQNEKWFLVMGDQRITETKETKEEALDELKNSQWFITMSMAAIVLEKMLAEKKYWTLSDIDEINKALAINKLNETNK